MGPNLPVFILSPGSVIHEGRGDREALVFDDWLVLHFTDPAQLFTLSETAAHAANSLASSAGWPQCDGCLNNVVETKRHTVIVSRSDECGDVREPMDLCERCHPFDVDDEQVAA